MIENAEGKEVFRIISRQSGEAVGSYSRACHDEYDFESLFSARNANCHGIFRNGEQYKVSKYRVIYELIEDDVPGETDPPRNPHDPITTFDDVMRNVFSEFFEKMAEELFTKTQKGS
jgi:hypothetical protein